MTHMGPIIHPFVGRLANEVKLDCNSDEVAEIFTVPLNFLLVSEPRVAHMELANRATADFPFDLLPRHPHDWYKRKGYNIYFYEYQGHVIWGLTARILHGFINGFIKNCRLIFCNWVWERKKRIEKLILLIVAAIAAASYLVYAYMNGDPMFGTLAKTMDDLPRNERLGSKRNIVVIRRRRQGKGR